MWTQIVGKIALALTPRMNHFWNTAFHLTARGLTTQPLRSGDTTFAILFDFTSHRLTIQCADGGTQSIPLEPRTVADFYSEFMSLLGELGIDVHIFATPVEVTDPVPFAEDRLFNAYDADAAYRFWRILLSCDAVFTQFRSRFVGKNSPIHFFWGSFDLAVTRFSGRRAPERPGADVITREAYSHEVISAGWWPGAGLDGPAFYCYAAPEPAALSQERVRPDSAFYHLELKEFILMYDNVRQSKNPDDQLLQFLQSTYDAAARLAHWDRKELEVTPQAA